MVTAGGVADGWNTEAEVWLLIGTGLYMPRIFGELNTALEREFGQRYAVVSTEDLLLGVKGGRLTLHDLTGRAVRTPKVVYARLSSPRVSTDREITLLRQLQEMGATLLNPPETVLACVNKFWQLQQFALAGLPVPDTLSYTDAPMSAVIRAGVPEPCVVKAVRGQRGQQVFLAPDAAMLSAVHGSLRQDVPYLFQHYVASSHGRDLRVVVIDGQAVAAQVRTARDGGLQSNLAQGGTAELCLGRYRAGEALAVQAAKTLGLGVCGVDLLFGADGGFVLCEVNVNVGWREAMREVTPAIVAACRRRLEEH
ncbi:RimK family alpha-L-glutamate ligase [Kitasatospora sp. NPDC101155]|uniref:RimK family alpha-L-glutamate ligase n=1 Tax=Kitasatospora sp. NPDC101155 TaxID=3364097 RepID=UPI003809DCB1